MFEGAISLLTLSPSSQASLNTANTSPLASVGLGAFGDDLFDAANGRNETPPSREIDE